MDSILNFFTVFFSQIFNIRNISSPGVSAFMQRLVALIVADPLIMAAASIFFVGVIIAFFMRVYHSIL